MQLNRDQATQIFDLLQRELKIHESLRANFVYTMSSPGFRDEPCSEYRIQGVLGFGGKLLNNDYYQGCPLRVSCYAEDCSPENEVLIEVANKYLADLVSSWPHVEGL